MEGGVQDMAAPEDGVLGPIPGSGSLLDNGADSDAHMGEMEALIDYSLLDEPDLGPPPPPSVPSTKERTDYGKYRLWK